MIPDNVSCYTDSSLCAEEKLRRLFYLCDDNGDELIDSDDLFTMCRELDMENAFDAVMADLGTGAESLISLEFVRRGLAVH